MVHVANEHVGLVIGKSGATIKHLETTYGVRVHIAKECAPGSSKRPITLVGTSSGAKQARSQIEGLVSSMKCVASLLQADSFLLL